MIDGCDASLFGGADKQWREQEGKDTKIPEYQMIAMKRMLGQVEYPVEVNTENLKSGQKIKINAGMMSGLEAELIRVHGNNKVTLRMPGISFNLMIDLPFGHFEVINY